MGPDQKKIDALEKAMESLGIKKEDIRIKFILSSGRGGQKVNKTASAVFISHEKTGISVKFGKHRSQHLNRFFATRILVEKIKAKMMGQDDREILLQEKIKKQKLRRQRKNNKKLAVQDPCRIKDE